MKRRSWRRWFDGERYLGVSSARIGPDPVEAPEKQKCGCDVCSGPREAAKSGASSTKSVKTQRSRV